MSGATNSASAITPASGRRRPSGRCRHGHRDCHHQIGLMGEGHRDLPQSGFDRHLACPAGQRHRGRAPAVAGHFDVTPAQALPEAAAQDLAGRFLGAEPAGQPLGQPLGTELLCLRQLGLGEQDRAIAGVLGNPGEP